MKNRHVISLIMMSVLLMSALHVSAQNEGTKQRTDIINTKLVGIGASQILDTYISPEHYNGMELRFIDNTVRRKTAGLELLEPTEMSPTYRKWSTTITHQAYLASTSTRSDNSNDITGLYTISIGRQRHWDMLANRLHVRAGGMGEVGIGFLYNTRNGNNPGQIRLGMNIAPTATAEYDFKAFGKRMTLGYEMQVPLLGLMFTPHYGQSYYEIFTRGNYDHNIVVTTPFNAPSLRHALTLQLHLKKISLNVGFLGDFKQSDVNNLKNHSYSHLVVVGFTRRFHIVNH